MEAPPQKTNSQKYLIQSTPNAVSNHRLVHHIPRDIVEQILSFLPVESLLRFRCVSKSWRALISSPDFIKAHLQNSSNNATHIYHRVLLKYPDNHGHSPRHCIESFSLFKGNQVVDSVDMPWDFFHLEGSCDGLVCISWGNDVWLWNPSTKKYRKLPKAGEQIKACFNRYGFGFDESTNDYKIVKLESLPNSSSSVKVYSRKTDSWKSIEDFPVCPGDITGLPLFLNGKIHWLRFYSIQQHIVSLDVQTEIYGNIQLPSLDGIEYMNLGSLGGCLSLLLCYYKYGYNLWMLKEYGVKESWTNVVNIRHLDPHIEYPLLLSYMLNDGQILLLFGSIFVVYNPKSQSWRSGGIHAFDCYKYYAANIYVESLVSPSADDGPEVQSL